MSKQSHIVVGLGYGDEGKGSWVDYLVRKHDIKHVVRFNGGSQAAHHVVAPDGLTHCFSQFGSGTLVPGVNTCLTHYMLINPVTFLREAEFLCMKGVPILDRVFVDKNCPVITPFNALLNRILELSRGVNKHGSCGSGVGLTQGDVNELGDSALYVRDLIDPVVCRKKMDFLYDLKLKIAEETVTGIGEDLLDKLRNIDIASFVEAYSLFIKKVNVIDTSKMLEIINKNSVVFEGAQGVLLDQGFGFYPHITRSNATFVNALELLEQAGFDGEVIKIGLLRGYGTRHGAGPFVTEDSALQSLAPCHNQTNQWQGNFRLGWFDCLTAKYALDVVGGVDVLALTNLDRILTARSSLQSIKICKGYKTDLAEFFSGPNHIESIKSLGGLDLERSVIRTNLLKKCQPIYEEVGFDEDAYFETIERHLEHEVGAISKSPTASGKVEFDECSVFC